MSRPDASDRVLTLSEAGKAARPERYTQLRLAEPASAPVGPELIITACDAVPRNFDGVVPFVRDADQYTIGGSDGTRGGEIARSPRS
jgi:hypothetical protein